MVHAAGCFVLVHDAFGNTCPVWCGDGGHVESTRKGGWWRRYKAGRTVVSRVCLLLKNSVTKSFGSSNTSVIIGLTGYRDAASSGKNKSKEDISVGETHGTMFNSVLVKEGDDVSLEDWIAS